MSEKLNVGLMREAANKLTGTHDFAGFSSVKKASKSTTRTIEEIIIKRDGHMVEFTLTGDGFLYNMVRIIIGSLVEIGLKEKDISYIDEILASKTRAMAGKTLPPEGLFLDAVTY
jgi:tRNA pseudouridine38-40 synthase